MNIRYDPDADAMYITLKEGTTHKTKEVDENIIFDYDKQGTVIGIELLFVKERMPHLLEKITVKHIST